MATTQIIAEPAVPQVIVTREFAAPRELLFRGAPRQSHERVCFHTVFMTAARGFQTCRVCWLRQRRAWPARVGAVTDPWSEPR